MNPYTAYQQQSALGWTRIDLLLALYDGTIARLEKALEALKQNDLAAAKPLLTRSQLLVAQMAAGVIPEPQGKLNNFLRLYEFVLHSIRRGGKADLDGALRVLRTLREGWEGIREEAVRLERSGEIPPADITQILQAVV